MAYGKCIESNFIFDVLPEVDKTEDSVFVDVKRVTTILRDSGTAVRPCNAQGRAVHIVSHVTHVVVQVDSILSCELWFSSSRIHCLALNEISSALLQYWILQQILPLYLLLNGSTEFLHGMAVSSYVCRKDLKSSSNFASMAFLGESYAGKSTLLGYFLTRGHSLVTDDHLALSRQEYTKALPAPPYYRAYRAPEDMGVLATAYSPNPSKLQRVYLLKPAPPEAAPRIESLTGMEAITALFPYIHYSLYNSAKPDFFPLVEDRFRGLVDIARKVPIARLHVPRSLDRLPEVYDFIQSDLLS